MVISQHAVAEADRQPGRWCERPGPPGDQQEEDAADTSIIPWRAPTWRCICMTNTPRTQRQARASTAPPSRETPLMLRPPPGVTLQLDREGQHASRASNVSASLARQRLAAADRQPDHAVGTGKPVPSLTKNYWRSDVSLCGCCSCMMARTRVDARCHAGASVVSHAGSFVDDFSLVMGWARSAGMAGREPCRSDAAVGLLCTTCCRRAWSPAPGAPAWHAAAGRS